MQVNFYSHLIETDSIRIELDTLSLSDKEKTHLMTLLHSSIHTVVLDIVLSEIPEHDKKHFLHHLDENNHDKIWKFLEKRTIALEPKIKKRVKELIEEFKKDISSVKGKGESGK